VHRLLAALGLAPKPPPAAGNVGTAGS